MLQSRRLPDKLLLLTACVVAGLTALAFGFSPDWDMMNYHLYNPHALLHGRLDRDLAPAQLQTYLNPLFHLPFYLVFRQFHPGVLVFLVGVIQGSQVVLLARILARLLPSGFQPAWLVWVVAGLGMCGPIFLHELGGTLGDSILSIPVLAGLLLLLGDGEEGIKPGPARAALFCGILLGLATALKLTFAPYAIAMGIALLWCRPVMPRWRLFGRYVLGGTLGFLVAGGGWFAYLWLTYQNPFFPYFNGIFHSSWVGDASFRDIRFMPRSTWEWLAYPLAWLTEPRRVWEFLFRDPRVVALYVIMLAAPLVAWRKPGSLSPRMRLVLIFLAISYVLWLLVFSIYRYLVVIEMLAPLVLFSLFLAWFPGRKNVTTALVLLLASQLFVVYERPPTMWELQSGSPSSLASLPGNALVLVAGYDPVSYAALWLDDAIPMVRIRANFMNQEEPETRIQFEAERRVRGHTGPVFLLRSDDQLEADYLPRDLARVGLEQLPGDACRPVFLQHHLQRKTGLRLCQLARTVAAPVQSGT